ncbi:semaphorin-4B-like [Odontesthes bonariensis]|uniref:semaphorin-4B-like n=1 Tax=Odontesthes bonariensis TaxID=219752 RepID=UPI003F58D29A
MASSVLLLFLGLLLSATGSLPPPRISFVLNSPDRPLVHFSLSDVHNTTTLLLSEDGSTLYVGAQDAVLSLDVGQSDVIRLKKKVQWSPTEDEIKRCESKGKNPTVDCPNFVHVLQPLNSTHLYACGSYAYSPHDAYIDVENLSVVHQDGARGRCPFSPFQRTTAVTNNGELFTATTTDFRGVEPQISRFFSKGGRPDVSLESSASLLEDPTFVSSSLDPEQQKLYFFFSEDGKEFSFVDNLKISRVAQVCKDDVGGQRTLQKKWTSFAKAPLLCKSHKRLPFNILQDVFTLPPPEGSSASDMLFYGVFTSQWSRRPESAVCVFRLQDIRSVFDGTFKTLDMESLQWSPIVEKHSHLGKCGLNSYSDSVLMDVKKSFLTSRSVTPLRDEPVVVTSEQQYSRVAVMRTLAANGRQYTLLFLLTESGFLHKVVLLDQGPKVIEEIQVFTQPQLMKSMVLSSSKGVLYVGTSAGVTAVPVARCSVYRSCSQCVLATDPLCGWSRTGKACTALGGGHQDIVQTLENNDVEAECRGENEAPEVTGVPARVNQAVHLPCLKPSNLATLSWTSPQFGGLPEKLFLRSADGGLRFFASADTFGSYSCTAREGGYEQVVASYHVRQAAPPRSWSPLPKSAERPEPVKPEEPTPAGIRNPEDAEDLKDSEDASESQDSEEEIITANEDFDLKNKFPDSEEHVIGSKGDAFITKTDFGGKVSGPPKDGDPDVIPTSRRDGLSGPKPNEPNDARRQRSYHSELVVVSFLLAACVCALALGSLHVWRRGKPGLGPEDGSKTHTSVEICSLSSPEDAELKVVQ